MRSTIAWLDHSEAQRRRMMEVVNLFKERTTVDDMGVGSVRNTFSDLLFPGISTLHTRAKYLLFLPWIGLRLEAEGIPSRRGWERLKDLEVQLIHALLRGGETVGVIGRDAREKLKQFPSFMYWGALGSYGILTLPYNRGQYIASLDAMHESRRRAHRTDDGDPVSGIAGAWHVEVPSEEPGFLDQATFDLTADQAGYLTDRILASAATSFLAHIVQSDPVDDVGFPWEHPAYGTTGTTTRAVVDHARRFSLVIHGAALLYNLLLAEAVREARTAGETVAVDEDLVDTYTARFYEWADEIEAETHGLAGWDRTAFWGVVTENNPRVPPHTRTFVDTWISLVMSGDPHLLVDDLRARDLIRAREFRNKGGLARLRNPRALERWTGAVGTGRLGFRWGTVIPIVNEIVRGREGSDAGT